MTVRRTIAAVIAAGALAVLGGCGGESKTATDVVEPDQSTGATTSTGGGSEDEPGDNEPGDNEPGDDTGDHYNAKTLLTALRSGMEEATSAHFSMSMSGAASLDASGVMNVNGDSPSMDMTFSGGAFGGKARVIVVDGAAYISLPTLPKGKFMASDPDDPNDPLAGSVDSLTESASLDSQFEAWEAGMTGVKYVGDEEIDGADTDHYRLTVNAAKAFKAQGSPMVPGMPKTFTYDLWIDGDNKMRKVSFELATVTTTMEMSDWGKPVHVKAPPASKIISN
jgi:hypothetical protein